MQQRFCTCGAAVWVRYLFANTRWLAFFYRGEAGEMSANVCPVCAKALNIENLR